MDTGRQADLAHEAVTTIVRIHAVDSLAGLSQGRSLGLDKPALCTLIDQPGRQFLKWTA